MPEADAARRQELLRATSRRPTTASSSRAPVAYDWGMQNRLARIFRPESGRTVMLAIDHGYFQGPTTGLERVDLDIVPIAPLRRRADADARDAALDDPADLPRRDRDARQRRAEHPQGPLRRADRGRHRGRGRG